MAAAPIDLSAGLVPNAAPSGVDISAGLIPKLPKWPPPGMMQESNIGIAFGSGNTSSSAIANPQQPAEQFALNNPEQQGTLAGAAGIGAAGSAAAAGAAIPLARALAPIATKYGILALKRGAAGGIFEAGRDLYKELKKVFEGEQENPNP